MQVTALFAKLKPFTVIVKQTLIRSVEVKILALWILFRLEKSQTKKIRNARNIAKQQTDSTGTKDRQSVIGDVDR